MTDKHSGFCESCDHALDSAWHRECHRPAGGVGMHEDRSATLRPCACGAGVDEPCLNDRGEPTIWLHEGRLLTRCSGCGVDQRPSASGACRTQGCDGEMR